MLRSTVSRVKKACSVALVPRILRDHCGVPVVSNAVVRKAHKSTKSTDDGNQYTFGSEDNVATSDEAASLGKTLTQTGQPLLPPSIPLTQRERCQKIIDKAFGNCEHTTEIDPEGGEQYFSHSVNLEEAKRKILEAEKRSKVEELHIDQPLRLDSRTQYSIYNMPHDLDDHDEVLHKVSIPGVHPTARGPNLDEDVESYVNNPESLENKALHDDGAETIEMGKDERRKYVYQEAQEQIQTLIPYSKTQFGVYSLTLVDDSFADPEMLTEPTLKIVVDSKDLDKTFGTNANEDVEECVINLESVEYKKLRDSDVIKHMFINATTTKEEEEQLTQKLETIEETPLVEAQKPKLEVSNLTPKVLGDKNVLSSKSLENNRDSYPRIDLPGNLDDVAKRCLNSPLGQIDEILLNEIEKLPFTRKTERKATLTHLRDILIQMDDLKLRPNSSSIGQQEKLSKSSKFEEEEKARTEKLCITGLMNPTRHYTELPDLNKQTKEDGQPARETAEVIKQEMEEASPLKNTKLNEAIVSDMHVVTGVDSKQESKGTASIANNLSRDAQNSQWPSAAETENSNSKVTSKGVHRPSDGTVNASNYAMHGQQLQEAGRNSFYSRNLYNGPNMRVHKPHNASASETDFLLQKGETDEIERQGQTPQGQSAEEEGVEHKQNTANKEFERVPCANFRLPDQEWNKQKEHLPNGYNKAIPLCAREKSSLTEPRQECGKGSLTDDLLKEHVLDPYYVLACNETCPIAPVSTIATTNNSDFVDTTESLRMKNNQESRRHKPLPRDLMTPKETEAIHELDRQFEPEVLPESEYKVMPGVEYTVTRDVLHGLPSLSDNVSLSELLRRVRQRNRLNCIGDLKAMGLSVSPTVGVGKCPRPAPRCPPTAPRSPPSNPVPPPTFGLPMLKGRPRVCKPKKRKPKCKCTACETDVSCGVQIGEICPQMAFELSEAEVCALTSKPDWTKVVIDRIESLGIVLNGALRQVKSTTETLFAREYDPWAPIPSWPAPTKVGNPCDKKCKPIEPCGLGCPLSPKARASITPDPPCDMKPCEGFPKRTYSMLDFFAVSLGDTKVNDLGHF